VFIGYPDYLDTAPLDAPVDVGEAIISRGIDGNMAGEQYPHDFSTPSSPSFSTLSSTTSSARNPFRASWSGPSFSYSLHGKAKTIRTGPCRVYQTIFEGACSTPYYILGIPTCSML
jgi:hypothetical protein